MTKQNPRPSVTFALDIPLVPNFLRTIAGAAVPVYHLPDDTLREIGRRWTEELLLKARKQRDKAAL